MSQVPAGRLVEVPGWPPCVLTSPMLPSTVPITASASASLAFETQSTGPHDSCLRFAVRLPVRLQTPRKTRFRPVTSVLRRSGLSPAGRSPKFQFATSFLFGQAFLAHWAPQQVQAQAQSVRKRSATHNSSESWNFDAQTWNTGQLL
jgi:hypothetical protein